ncbi:MAG: hypothetical protein K8T26_13915 [Lentisphaerae bacterium]|nr:hypothetical protein [Lentisphaerota bacterium]
MSAVTEMLVREYFEMQGYLISQPRKYNVPGRPKTADEEVDLVVVNPTIHTHVLPASFVLTTADLRTVARAVVGVRGWHTDRFYTSTFEKTPEILRFVQPASVKFAAEILGATDMAKILCLPKLPASGELKDRTIKFLKERGVDGVISFRTILAELVSGVDVNKNYEKSDLLQVIRLLKNYELVRDDQLELFAHGRRKSKVKAPASNGAAG